MSAYVCMRGVGSEPENGYNYLRAAAARHEVTVLTHEMFAAGLQEAMAEGDLPPVTVVTFSTPDVIRRRAGHLDYLLWQRRARAWAEARLADFDVVHHATYGTDWMPAGVLGLRGVPVVWGSVGGCAPLPWRLARFLPPRGLAAEIVREALTRPLRRIVLRRVLASGCLVVSRNEDTARFFRKAGADVVVDPQVVVLPDPPDVPVVPPGPLRRAVFVSKLVPWKGPLLAVRTIARLGADWRLEFYGAGPAEGRIRALAGRLGVADRVTLHGRRPKSEVLDALRSADVLIFPSMHDSAPMPVAEAGWAGCPVVCLDIAGPPVLIAGTTGRAVPAGPRADRALADAARGVRRHPPSTRWSAAAMEDAIDSWYQRVASPAASTR